MFNSSRQDIIKHLDVGEYIQISFWAFIIVVYRMPPLLRRLFAACIKCDCDRSGVPNCQKRSKSLLGICLLSRFSCTLLRFSSREIRKIMHISCSLHLKSSIQRIYLPRHQGCRGLLLSLEEGAKIHLTRLCIVVWSSKRLLPLPTKRLRSIPRH